MARKKLELPDPKENDVLACDGKHRRVLRIFQDRVFYSVGSDNNRHCKLATFKRWARKAEIVHAAT